MCYGGNVSTSIFQGIGRPMTSSTVLSLFLKKNWGELVPRYVVCSYDNKMLYFTDAVFLAMICKI